MTWQLDRLLVASELRRGIAVAHVATVFIIITFWLLALSLLFALSLLLLLGSLVLRLVLFDLAYGLILDCSFPLF